MQIYHTPFFSISWGPFENVNFLYFLLKMQIWNGCNACNIAGKSIRDMNVNLTFLSSGSEVVEWMLLIGKFFWVHFWGQDQKLLNGPPRSDINVNLTFSVQHQKVVAVQDQKLWNGPPQFWYLVLHCSTLWVWILWDAIFCLQLCWVCAVASIFGVIEPNSWQ